MQFFINFNKYKGYITIPDEIYFVMSSEETVLADVAFTYMTPLPNAHMDIIHVRTLHKYMTFELHSEESHTIATKLLLGLPVTITKEVHCKNIQQYGESVFD